MKLTASPFNPETGELLPVYREAYLRGDLSNASARAVEEHLRANSDQAHSTLSEWHELQAQEELGGAPNWVQRQIRYIQAEPLRFRRRAASLVTGAALLGGAVFAGTNLPTDNLPTELVNVPTVEAASNAEASSALSMVTVRGRILDESGKPLVGATVLHKGTYRGVSTDADGSYTLRVPAGQQTLVYGYGGYSDHEMQVQSSRTADVKLHPRAKQRRWLLF